MEPDVVPPARSRPGAPNAATPNAVLGLLSFGQELSGYDLKKWADHSLRFFFWSPAISQIYSELRRLESLGYVTSRVVAKDDTRSRRLYRITEEGREWLAHWLVSEPADVPVLKHPTVLRVWLGHLMEPAALREAVIEHRNRVETQLGEVREDRRWAAANESMAYAELVIRWAERYYGAELENTNRLLEDLAELDERSAQN
ncbi:MAG: PadR family transcriptional regulator [Acidimicrobiales bacterium]